MPQRIAELSLLINPLQFQPVGSEAPASPNTNGQKEEAPRPTDLRRALSRWENEGGATVPASCARGPSEEAGIGVFRYGNGSRVLNSTLCRDRIKIAPAVFNPRNNSESVMF
jgi:hypothetical protein